MKAMVFAAGLGTRLRPLTDSRPKALVDVGGCTLLELTIKRLQAFGISEVIVNVHHFADVMIEYLKEKNNFGIRIEVSREDLLLDTGGGLKKASWFFRESGNDEPFIVHNVDVISNIDLQRLLDSHNATRALATLAVQQRSTSRYLLFNDDLQLCGRRAGRGGEPEIVRPAPHLEALAFSGIHVLSPRIFDLLDEDGAFSIIPAYLRLGASGEAIRGFRADQYYWRDVGRPEHLAMAADELKQHGMSSIAT
jgi:NDP-sugar pyrophosphorylase family protein